MQSDNVQVWNDRTKRTDGQDSLRRASSIETSSDSERGHRMRKRRGHSGAGEPDAEQAGAVAPGDAGYAPGLVDDGGAGGAGAMVDRDFRDGNTAAAGARGDFEPEALRDEAQFGQP